MWPVEPPAQYAKEFSDAYMSKGVYLFCDPLTQRAWYAELVSDYLAWRGQSVNMAQHIIV